MKLKWALFAAFFLCAAVAVKAQEPGGPKPVAFRISSMGTPFAMQGDFEGEFLVYDEGIEVRLTGGLVRISEHCPYKGRRVFGAIKFALATRGDGGRWKMVGGSEKFWVERVMVPNDEYRLSPITFWIPREAGADLSKHWMVIQMDDVALDIPDGEEKKGYALAQSSRDIFLSR